MKNAHPNTSNNVLPFLILQQSKASAGSRHIHNYTHSLSPSPSPSLPTNRLDSTSTQSVKNMHDHKILLGHRFLKSTAETSRGRLLHTHVSTYPSSSRLDF